MDLPDVFTNEWIDEWKSKNKNPKCSYCSCPADVVYFISKGWIGPAIEPICKECKFMKEAQILAIKNLFDHESE